MGGSHTASKQGVLGDDTGAMAAAEHVPLNFSLGSSGVGWKRRAIESGGRLGY